MQDALVASGNQQVERAAIQTLHLILKGLGHRCIEVQYIVIQYSRFFEKQIFTNRLDPIFTNQQEHLVPS